MRIDGEQLDMLQPLETDAGERSETGGTMTYLTLGEAAKQAGVAKSTISKALRSGRLSYVSKSAAGYEIDPAELHRVFPPKRSATVAETVAVEQPETGAADRREIEMLREQLEDVKADRDAWREQAQRLALPSPDGVGDRQHGEAPRRRWWQF